MTEIARLPYVIGPDGERMTREDLPAPETRRWVPRRKARVVAAVEGGLIDMADAIDRYALSEEEFCQWRRAFGRHGLKGLCVTRRKKDRAASE